MSEFSSSWGLGLRKNTAAAKSLSENASIAFDGTDLNVSVDGSAYETIESYVGTANHVRGTATISGTDTTAVVEFATAQPDELYLVTGLVLTGPADSPTNPGQIWVTDQDEDGFTINFETAPGADKSWDINWKVER